MFIKSQKFSYNVNHFLAVFRWDSASVFEDWKLLVKGISFCTSFCVKYRHPDEIQNLAVFQASSGYRLNPENNSNDVVQSNDTVGNPLQEQPNRTDSSAIEMMNKDNQSKISSNSFTGMLNSVTKPPASVITSDGVRYDRLSTDDLIDLEENQLNGTIKKTNGSTTVSKDQKK
jgi:hypothetical protein